MHTIHELIDNIREGNRAAHAFAIEGRSGAAREDFINTLAAGLECSSSDGVHPCGRCPACLQTAAGTCMDIVRMSKSTGSSRTGRESYRTTDAAAFIERLSMGSYGRYLIGVIDDADSLSETIQNKLLKTFEEPSPDTILILAVSNRDNLLSTVRSRISIIMMNEYTDYEGMDDAVNEDEGRITEAILGIAGEYAEHTSPFCDIRAAIDKNIKSREDALSLMDAAEDALRDAMVENSRAGEAASSQAAAIELVNLARMDIRREMSYSKALRRLYLQLIECR